MRDQESFPERVARLAPARETQPACCSHCGTATAALENYSRTYGGNVGAHWLCIFCRVTRSAATLGAGGRPDDTVADLAAMLHVLHHTLKTPHGGSHAAADD